MRKYIQSILYVIFLLAALIGFSMVVSLYEKPFNFFDNPLVWVLCLLFLIIIGLREVVFIEYSKKLEDHGLLPKAEKQVNWFTNFANSFNKSKPIEQEGEILLNHDYDGIKELDNSLPPWWLYSFYISIVFAAVYLLRYHVFDGNTNVESFNQEMEEARIAVNEYKKNNPDTFSLDNLSASDNIEEGKRIFKKNCAACHAFDGGGGIGPNLTDKYWVLGGGIKNVYNTIANGGRDGKGMIAWKNSLKPEKMQQVASYIISLQGTTPENPKKAEGDLWEDEETKESKEQVTDSLSVSVKDTINLKQQE